MDVITYPQPRCQLNLFRKMGLSKAAMRDTDACDVLYVTFIYISALEIFVAPRQPISHFSVTPKSLLYVTHRGRDKMTDFFRRYTQKHFIQRKTM